MVNHREQGENYVAASGPDGRLLDRTLLHSLGTLRSPAATDSKSATDVGVKGVEETTVEGGASSHQLLSSAVEALNGFVLPLTPSENDVLKWSLLHFPPMSTVARFQYDFNLRRAGALGADKAHSLTKDTPQGAELSAAWNKVGQAIELCTTLQQRQSIDLDRVGKSYSRMIAATEELSAEHWVHVVDMVEKVIIPGAHIVHFSYTPLVALLPAPHNNYTQTLVLESAQDIEQPWEEALLQAGYRNKSAYFVHKTRLISQPSGVTAGKYSLAVLDTRQPAIATGVQGKVWTEQLRGALSSSSSPVEHLLVVGACSAAPTDLSVYYGNNLLYSSFA